MPVILRLNPDKTIAEIETPAGDTFGPEDVSEDPFVICCDAETPIPYVVLAGEFPGLKSNTAYQLVEVATDVIEGDLELPEDDDDEDEEETIG